MHNEGPTMASLLRKSCQVTHFKNSHGWIETPDGRFFKPESAKIQFIKGFHKPLISRQKVNKGFSAKLAGFIKDFFK